MSFTDLGLFPAINDHLQEKGYTQPTPIQAQAIPAILDGKDVMAAAQTGTGKTAAFCLPVLQQLSQSGKASNNQIRALVLTPTRELAAQVMENAVTYGEPLGLHTEVVYGGVKINPQMQRLRRGADLLVATPGRLLDLYQQNAIRFDQLEVLILDEADRMLDMGFIHDLKRIMALLPQQRQNLMFSATFADRIRDLAKGLMQNPVQIDVTPPNSTAKKVKQWLIPVDKKQKPALLIHLIKQHDWHQVLVFSRTKHGANKVVRLLEAADIRALAIHGNKSQSARMNALAQFKNNEIQVLVATDIAARGLDISQLPMVINLDLPNVAEDYVHRIGRTGRAEQSGEALSLVCADEFDDLSDIERLIQKHIEREYEPGFEPVHELPAPKPILPPKRRRPKKPKKPSAAAAAESAKPNPRPKNKSGFKPRGKPAGKPQTKSGSKPQGKPSGKPAGKRPAKGKTPAKPSVRKRPTSR